MDSDAISNKIENLESQFIDLHKCIREELMVNENMNVKELLQRLTLLPIRLRSEYQKLISEKLPTLPREGSISELFLHLNPLFTFIDYHLLEYIINVFGSNGLKIKMKSYTREISSFLKQTTIQQLIDCWPCQEEEDPKVYKMIAKIDKDAKSCSLHELNTLRRKICVSVRLSDVISAAVSFGNSTSFIVTWSLPSVLAPHVITSINETEEDFFLTEKIESLFVGDVKVYPRLNFAETLLAVATHPTKSKVCEMEEHNLASFASELKIQYQLTEKSISLRECVASQIIKVSKLTVIHEMQLLYYWQTADDLFRKNITGKVDDILSQKTSIDLENIFKANKSEHQQIVLIEGGPSSGKSSLAIYICQKWGNGELFEEFSLVILVQLGDPAVQRAQSISDLLPCQEVAVARKLASELKATKGHGVLWILDGWDELTPQLRQDSIFRQLMPPNRDDIHGEFAPQTRKFQIPLLQTEHFSLGKSSFIITSRPISSSDLHLVVSYRIELVGFSPEEQRQYFTECLEGDTKVLKDLLEKIQDNPVVQSSCYIPLNAALTLHYFKFKGHSLPNTEYEMFATVIFSCIKHQLEQEGKGHDLPVALESLGDLLSSKTVGEHFKRLCELAYNGVMQHKVTFSPSDLPQGSSTLGLLHQIDSFLEGGKSVFYRFFHHSLLEVLAAMHIATCLSDSEQVSQFQKLFDQPHFASVFRFYSAITKLKTPGIDNVVIETSSGNSIPQVVHLLQCLYEAQDPCLCQSVARHARYLDLHGASLSPLECLSIGYFISLSSSDVSKEANLINCQIGDNGVKLLTKFMCESRCSSPVSHTQKTNSSQTKLKLDFNGIHEDGAASIAKVLRSVSSVIISLSLMGNPIGGKGLQFISQALITNTSLVELDLSNCSLVISKENGPIVTKMLIKNKTLRKLDLSCNENISDTGLSYIVKGLKNSALKELKMSDITAQGGKSLATSITTSIVVVNINNLEITKESGPSFIDMLQRKTSLSKVFFNFSYRLSDVGVSFIAEGLRKNSTVKSLSLIKCNITSSGAKCLAEMLRVNSSLRSLYVDDNAIRDEGVAHIAEALKINKTLIYLSISFCEITDAGVASLTESLHINTTLWFLRLCNNRALTMEGVKPLLDVASRKSVGVYVNRDLPQHSSSL